MRFFWKSYVFLPKILLSQKYTELVCYPHSALGRHLCMYEETQAFVCNHFNSTAKEI